MPGTFLKLNRMKMKKVMREAMIQILEELIIDPYKVSSTHSVPFTPASLIIPLSHIRYYLV